MILKVWINAFIPKTVSGYTEIINKGSYSGKSAVPLPGLARLNPLNLFKDWDAGYLTDQRDFNNDPNASVRMQSLAEINIASKQHISLLKKTHKSSGTTEGDMDTGNKLGFAVADMSRCSFHGLLLKPAVQRSRGYRTFPLGLPIHVNSPANIGAVPSHVLHVEGKASDPLISASADINYRGLFEITLHNSPTGAMPAVFIDFTGYIDAFPAFECYAQFNGRTKCLFTAPPPPGNTVTNLPGIATRKISGAVSFP